LIAETAGQQAAGNQKDRKDFMTAIHSLRLLPARFKPISLWPAQRKKTGPSWSGEHPLYRILGVSGRGSSVVGNFVKVTKWLARAVGCQARAWVGDARLEASSSWNRVPVIYRTRSCPRSFASSLVMWQSLVV
jgi:hypothetical protein